MTSKERLLASIRHEEPDRVPVSSRIHAWLVEARVDILSTCTPPPMGDFDLAESKRNFGSRICFKGYTDLLYVIKNGTPESIEKAVRDAIEIGKHDGGFILGSSDSFRDGIPVENVRAYFDAAHRYD